jgi:hypothetical protein
VIRFIEFSSLLFGVWFGEIRCAGSHCAFPTNRSMVMISLETYHLGWRVD